MTYSTYYPEYNNKNNLFITIDMYNGNNLVISSTNLNDNVILFIIDSDESKIIIICLKIRIIITVKFIFHAERCTHIENYQY